MSSGIGVVNTCSGVHAGVHVSGSRACIASILNIFFERFGKHPSIMARDSTPEMRTMFDFSGKVA